MALKDIRRWFGRVRYIQGEWPFLSKPGKPVEIRNDDKQLHCATGPAIRTYTYIAHYENGRKHGVHATRWGSLSYYFKGVLVPPKYILEPEKLTFEEVISHPNAEIRRVGCEAYGFDRMEKEKKFELLDHDEETGAKLLKCTCLAKNDEPLVIVKVLDGTPDASGNRKVYTLQVPPDSKRCKEAIAWTFYKNEKDYKPSIER